MLTFTEITGSITQVQSDKPTVWKCNGLIIETKHLASLIDWNFDIDEIRFNDTNTLFPWNARTTIDNN